MCPAISDTEQQLQAGVDLPISLPNGQVFHPHNGFRFIVARTVDEQFALKTQDSHTVTTPETEIRLDNAGRLLIKKPILGRHIGIRSSVSPGTGKITQPYGQNLLPDNSDPDVYAISTVFMSDGCLTVQLDASRSVNPPTRGLPVICER